MKIGKNTVTERLGSGCSRNALLLDNGLVCKTPRYDDPNNDCGISTMTIFNELLREFENVEAVVKVRKLQKKGYSLPEPCRGILTEYLFSLKIRDEVASEYFAHCVKVKVRKRKNHSLIDIKGFYENAYDKERLWDREEEAMEQLPYNVGDLHCANYVNGYIVDYASLYK